MTLPLLIDGNGKGHLGPFTSPAPDIQGAICHQGPALSWRSTPNSFAIPPLGESPEFIKADAIIPQLRDHLIILPVDVHRELAGVGMLDDIGQRFLENAVDVDLSFSGKQVVRPYPF